MADLLVSLLFVVVFAWVARALLGAKELTWPRTLLAAVAGMIFGQSIGVLILVQNLAQLPRIDAAEVIQISVPFMLVGTMGAMVVLELLFSRPSRRRGLRWVRPLRAIQRRWRIVRRGSQISRILVSNGLAPLLGLRRGDVSTRTPAELARRIRVALEQAGGTFIKVGQLLATRPDLVPPVAQAELGRLHSTASPLPRAEVERVLGEAIDKPLDEVFDHIDWEPLGSASIAQAHLARRTDGTEVVVKVRRPGLEQQVEVDLSIAAWLARTAERRTQWARVYGLSELVAEFAEVLRGELDFEVEARNAVEAAAALDSHPRIVVPRIDLELTSTRVLVMERLIGQPLSRVGSLPAESARDLADALCVSQAEAMLSGEVFHGDPHPGNVLLLDDGRLGLIDFGIAGRLDTYERGSVLQILLSLHLEQPTLLYEALVTLGAIGPDRDPQEIERSLARFLSTHIGSGLPSPEALTELLRLAAQMQMRLPRSATTMFRALATLAGTVEQMSPGYPLIDVIADVGGAELRDKMMPGSLGEMVKEEWARLGPLIQRAPRHFDRIATLLEHGRLTTRLRLFTDDADVNVLERLLNRLVLTFLSIGTGVVSVLLLSSDAGPAVGLLDVTLVEMLGWTGLTLAVTLLLRVLLAVLRSEGEDRTGRLG